MNYIKVVSLVLFTTLGSAFSAKSMDLENIRANYEKAVSDKRICQAMIEKLGMNTENSLHLAYLGAFQAIWAKHTANPVSKLSTFNTGKRNIEDAVRADPDNVEIRFVRLSVQQNCPSFLGYRNNIEEDKRIIQANNKNITSVHLKRMLAGLI